jgi:arsenate reductase
MLTGGDKMIKKVLFVCIHNSFRSQIAEAYLNHLGKGKFIAESAGLEPGKVSPLAIKVMQEEGIDISGQHSKGVAEFLARGDGFDFVITVCDGASGERCPLFPGSGQRLHFEFKDPAVFSGTEVEVLQQIREVRDQIKQKIQEFIR